MIDVTHHENGYNRMKITRGRIEAEPITASEIARDVRLTYRDNDGRLTNATVTINRIAAMSFTDGSVEARRLDGFNHDAKASVSLSTDQIQTAIDPGTGQALNDLWSWATNEGTQGQSGRWAIGQKQQAQPKKKNRRLRVLVGVLGVIAVVTLVETQNDNTPTPSEPPVVAAVHDDAGQANSTAQQSGSIATPAETTPAVHLPKRERALIQTVDNYSRQYTEAANDMQKGALRVRRARAICDVLDNDTAARLWAGTIKDLSSNGDGRGVMAITVADDLTVETTNNAISDSLLSEPTLIDPQSKVGQVASKLKVGDHVYFSGRFLSASEDCIYETSVTQEGSMTDPEFMFVFADLQQAP